jgi:hypothetical protein
MKPPKRKDVQHHGRIGGLPLGSRRKSPWVAPQHTRPRDIFTTSGTYRSLASADVGYGLGAASGFTSGLAGRELAAARQPRGLARHGERIEGAQMSDRGRQGPIVGPAGLGAELRGRTIHPPVQPLGSLHSATATARDEGEHHQWLTRVRPGVTYL